MLRWSIKLVTVFFISLLSSCGESLFDQKFYDAARAQEALDSQTLLLWKHSPAVDSGRLSTNANSDLNRLTRSKVKLENLFSMTEPIESSALRVFNNSREMRAPRFIDFAGRNIDVNSEDFKSFMAYAHLNRGIRAISTMFSSDLISDIQEVFPILVFSAERAFPASTGFYNTIENGQITESFLAFFQDSRFTPAPRLNFIDDAGVIYHELAHVFQKAINSSASVLGESRDLLIIGEALADFYAAALTKSENMFQYIENHNSLMANPVSRLGVQRKRPPVNRLFFPDAHINQSHLDGRILVGALVDLKKLISEGSIQKTNCAAPCDLSFSFPTVNQDIAFDAVNSLAFEAYSDLVSSSTLRAYAGLLLAAVSGNTHMQSVCNGNASCMSELESDFEEILLSRGLIQDNSYNIISDGDTIEASANVATELGWLPFLGSSRADDDDKIEPCELIVVFPQFSNQSESNGTKMSFYNIEAKLFDVDGFKNVFNFSTGSLVDIIFDDLSTVEDERRSKVLGWMEPEDNNLSLMRVPSTSIWYRNFETATLMRPLSTTVNPHGGGWMVEAPETKGETATIDFIVKVQAFSGNSTAEGSAVKTFAISQSLTVADTSVTNFCP